MESKHQYIVKVRLEPKVEFELMGVDARHPTFLLAQEAATRWIDGKADLPKAKPEAIVEAIELPYVRDCSLCGCPLFVDDVVYITIGAIYCYDCSIKRAWNDGYYNLLEMENEIEQ